MLVNHVNTELIHQHILAIETCFQQCDGLIVSRAVCCLGMLGGWGLLK